MDINAESVEWVRKFEQMDDKYSKHCLCSAPWIRSRDHKRYKVDKFRHKSGLAFKELNRQLFVEEDYQLFS